MVLSIYNSPLHFFLTKLTMSIKVIQMYMLTIFEKGYEKFITNLYESCGITINGKNPWDIQVLDKRFYKHVAIYSNKGLGEAYMEGYWTCKDMPEMFKIVLANGITRFMTTRFHRILNFFNYHLFNLQTKAKAWEVGQQHYDIGNEVFKSFLDKTMTYSCGYWKNAKTVDEAQEHKMELIAKKLHLKPGMKVLDIGCGWGGLCYYLAKNYGVSVVGITISKEGAKTAAELCKNLPVDIRLIDYRDLDESFDRIVSVGMFEHVGEKNYRTFFEVANRCLIDQGIFLLHSIGSNDPEMPLTEGFFDTYIFRNGVLPYVTSIPKYTEGLFLIEDWHNFGYDYFRTLEAWSVNFNKNWPTIENKMGEKFKRMWNYYLTVSGAAFRARKTQLWQIVLTKNGLEKGYVSVR